MGFIPSSKSTLGYRLDPFDVTSAFIAPILSLLIRDFGVFYSVSPAVIFIYIAVSAFLSVLFFTCFHVGRGLPGYLSVHDAAQIAKATFCAVISTTAFILFFTGIDGLPRSISIIHFFVLITMLSGSRLIQREMFQRRGFRNANCVSHENEEHVFIVGAGSLASLYVRYLESQNGSPRKVVAILDNNPNLHGRSILGHTIVGDVQELPALLDDFEQHGLEISAVVVCEADRELALEYNERLGSICKSRGLQLEMLTEAPAIFGGSASAPSRPSSTVNTAPIADYFRLKQVIEPVFAAFCLLVSLPLFALAGSAVLASLGWPVIFWQRRIGRNGRTLFVYKFKTMRNPIDRMGRRLAFQERHTRIGKILRATRLDELPQLLNVIKGEMSIIGPRPLLPVDQPAEASLRLAVAPGLTGWAQINGGKLITAEEKAALDEWYVRNASLRVDAEIAWRTVLTIVTGDRRNKDQLDAALLRAGRLRTDANLIQSQLEVHSSPNN